VCECGFIYRRLGWDENGVRKFEYDYVNSYGETFYKKLLKFKEEGLSKEDIATALGLSIGTIYSQLEILEKNRNISLNKTRSEFINNPENNEMRKLFRTEWINLQKQNPELGRSKLLLLKHNIYRWLVHNDKEWFELNSPVRQVIREKPNRIDWVSRDDKLSNQVYEVAKRLLSAPGYPIWISKTFLAKTLKIHHIVTKRPECMPKTLDALNLNSETNEEFIARRIRFVTDCFIQEKIRASYWKILMRARVIRPKLVNLPKVQEAIKESLERIGCAESKGWS
jgi:hypothetical protein